MESLKPILLLVVLSGVGYGVYVALNHAPPPEAPANLAPEWNPATGPGAAGSFAGTTNSVEAGGGSSAQPMSNPWLAAPGAANHWDAASAHDSAPVTKTDQAPSSPPAGIPGLPFSSGSAVTAPVAPGSAQSAPLGGQLPVQAATADQAAVDAQMRARFEYEASMRAAQTLASQGKLVDALRELSRWYDHPAVPTEDQPQLVEFLGQLAGSVIYSRKPFLAAPYVVRAGDSLESIAAQYQVPWQLLAKINGIDNPNNLIPGQELKVVRGPFTAQLNASQQWLTLFVDGLYAGRFRVQMSGPLDKPEGTYPVVKFAGNSAESNAAAMPYISLGGDLHLRVPADAVPPGQAAVRIESQDMNDVFDILSERSQVTIRR